jgi:hypothetical protein
LEGCVVMAKYGAHRTYKVHKIRWEMNPETCKFDQGEQQKKISMLQYFLSTYETKISDKN